MVVIKLVVCTRLRRWGFLEPEKKVAFGDMVCEWKQEVGRSNLDLVEETVASEGLELDDVPTGS